MRTIHHILLIAVGAICLVSSSLPAEAYPTYRDASPNCSSCHAGFVGGFGAPLHDTHLTAVGDCAACHTTPGSTPVVLDSSGLGPGCGGCHVAEGLRAHHTNAGAPTDDLGLTCANCHSDDPPPLPESVLPTYYGVQAPTLDPCDGSEELGATATISLDNDGDLLVDGADPDCLTGCFDDADCDDGSFCNGAESCDMGTGECLPGNAIDCDDGVGCTVDSCDESTDACVNAPDDGFCDNGLYCDGAEICDATVDCLQGEPPCDPVNEECDEAADACLPLGCTTDAECDDGSFCNGAETCDTATGDCRAGTPVDCSDGVDCTADSCDDTVDACVHLPDDGFCDNGIFCDGTETCDPALDCRSGMPADCDDGDLCTDDFCDAAIDDCVNTLDPTNDPSCVPGPNVHLRSESDCSNCHWTNRQAEQTDLRPLHGFRCASCHTDGFQSTFLGPLGTWNFACSDCHNTYTPETGFREEPTKGHRCVVCHGEQVGVGNPAGFHRKHIEAANCVVCHGFIPAPAPAVGPRGLCAVCHGSNDEGGASHQDVHRKHVPEGLSCLECHADVRPPVDADQVCYLCHDDRSARDSDLQDLHKKHSDKRMDCGACHADANLQDDRVPMPPIDDVVRASVDRGGAGACSTCHDGMSGDGSDAVHRKHVADQWQWCYNCHLPEDPRPAGLAGPATDPASSCVICHDDESFEDSAPFRVHEEHAEENKCYACHQTVPPIFDWPAAWGQSGGMHDEDGDGYDARMDCDDHDARTYPGAPEVNDGKDNQCRGDRGHLLVDETSGTALFDKNGGSTRFEWPGQLGATAYEVVRGTAPDFSGHRDYLPTTEPGLDDDTTPEPGRVFFYLNRPTTPHVGSWGADSSGVEREHVDP